jgi:hypothetical protein
MGDAEMSTIEGIDWRAEQDRFMSLAYGRTERAARRAFKQWHARKRDDAIQEALAKMWYQWRCCLEKGKDPAGMIGPLIHWALLHVRYDRRVAGRAHPDVYDYRSRMKRQLMTGQGKIGPADRSDPANAWINFAVSARTEDPAELVAAFEMAGMSTEEWAA